MDLVLEVSDYFYLDKIYAQLFPVTSTSSVESMLASASAAASGSSATSASEQVVAALKLQVPKLLQSVVGLHSSRDTRYGVAPTYFLPPTSFASQSMLPRDNIVRQFVSLWFITTVFGWILYFFTALFSYYVVYDHENFKHPKYLKNQVRMEIDQAMKAIPVMTLLTVPWFVAETQGYSKLFWSLQNNGGWTYFLLQVPLFLFFTDALIYVAHRGLHHPWVYKHLHKPHHKWIIPTPFASHAFHPVDGYIQSLPYHMFPFIFPLQKMVYLGLFGFVNIWTVMIHDGEYLAHDPVVNGSACHTIHHLYFNYNYGQYTTLWDRLGGTHRVPEKELFDPSSKKLDSTLRKQIKQMEQIQSSVEGHDDRVYASSSK